MRFEKIKLFSDKNGMKTVNIQTDLLHRSSLDNTVPSLIKKDNKEGVEVRSEIMTISVPQSSNSDEMTRTYEQSYEAGNRKPAIT